MMLYFIRTYSIRKRSDYMKRIIVLTLLTIVVFAVGAGFTESEETVLLARTLYTLAHNESTDTMLALGSVIMNRVDNVWFPDTITEVLMEPHQFAIGAEYNDRSLSVAREVISGCRTLDRDVVYYAAINSTLCGDTRILVESIGGFGFYKDV